MPYLFDASSFLNIVLEKGEKALELVEDNYFLDLSLYEIGNALWRARVLLDKLSADDVRLLMKVVMDLTAVMKEIPVSEIDVLETLTLAVRERITFYDASYITASKKKRLALVTDDRKLAKVASRHVEVKTLKTLV